MSPESSTTAPRHAQVTRNTAETRITVRIDLDGSGKSKLHTGIGFFDHMLDQIARHGLIDLDIQADGDLHIDGHHTVEDVGITLGQAMHKALGDRKGIRRFGHAYVPLDEGLCTRFARGGGGRSARGRFHRFDQRLALSPGTARATMNKGAFSW